MKKNPEIKLGVRKVIDKKNLEKLREFIEENMYELLTRQTAMEKMLILSREAQEKNIELGVYEFLSITQTTFSFGLPDLHMAGIDIDCGENLCEIDATDCEEVFRNFIERWLNENADKLKTMMLSELEAKLECFYERRDKSNEKES